MNQREADKIIDECWNARTTGVLYGEPCVRIHKLRNVLNSLVDDELPEERFMMAETATQIAKRKYKEWLADDECGRAVSLQEELSGTKRQMGFIEWLDKDGE